MGTEKAAAVSPWARGAVLTQRSKNAAYYRARAAEVRAVAESMNSGPARDVLRSIAGDYEDMAEAQYDIERTRAWLEELSAGEENK